MLALSAAVSTFSCVSSVLLPPPDDPDVFLAGDGVVEVVISESLVPAFPPATLVDEDGVDGDVGEEGDEGDDGVDDDEGDDGVDDDDGDDVVDGDDGDDVVDGDAGDDGDEGDEGAEGVAVVTVGELGEVPPAMYCLKQSVPLW
jgi:hypothetical protein